MQPIRYATRGDNKCRYLFSDKVPNFMVKRVTIVHLEKPNSDESNVPESSSPEGFP